VHSSFQAALRAFEQLHTVSHPASIRVRDLAESLERATDELWLEPFTGDYEEEVWPSCDMEPPHPRRRDVSRWTAREYRAQCRRWRREHRAWRRRPKATPTVMLRLRIEGVGLIPDGSFQRFVVQRVILKSLLATDPDVVDWTIKHMRHQLRTALLRHWEEL